MVVRTAECTEKRARSSLQFQTTKVRVKTEPAESLSPQFDLTLGDLMSLKHPAQLRRLLTVERHDQRSLDILVEPMHRSDDVVLLERLPFFAGLVWRAVGSSKGVPEV